MALRAQPPVTAITGARVGLSLTGTDPAIRYALTGGTYLAGGVVTATLQVECWGKGGNTPDDGTADRLARTVLSVIPGLVGDHGPARVAGASAAYPYRSDDPTTGRPRAIVNVTIVVSPLPQGA